MDYTQEQLDKMVSEAVAKATDGLFTKEQLDSAKPAVMPNVSKKEHEARTKACRERDEEDKPAARDDAGDEDDD